MCGFYVFAAVDESGSLRALEDARRVEVWDLDSKSLVEKVDAAGAILEVLELLSEKYDAVALFVAGIGEEAREQVEELGLKVVVAGGLRASDVVGLL